MAKKVIRFYTKNNAILRNLLDEMKVSLPSGPYRESFNHSEFVQCEVYNGYINVLPLNRLPMKQIYSKYFCCEDYREFITIIVSQIPVGIYNNYRLFTFDYLLRGEEKKHYEFGGLLDAPLSKYNVPPRPSTIEEIKEYYKNILENEKGI